MLVRENRVNAPAEFREIRRGKRHYTLNLAVSATKTFSTDEATQFGFIVTNQRGNAVMRNRIRRALREISRELIKSYPSGYKFVVFVQRTPESDIYSTLKPELVTAVSKLTRKLS